MIDKLEVGKTYIDGDGNIERCVGYDPIKDAYITVDQHANYNHYNLNGVRLDDEYSVIFNKKDFNLIKEYKELKTVNGWLIVAPNGGIITDNCIIQHGLTTNIPFATKEDAIKTVKSFKNFTGFSVIHLNNNEIKAVE